MENYNWEDIIIKARTINDHYSLDECMQEKIFNLLKDIPEGSVIVELGTAHGKTSAILAYIANHQKGKYHGVDNFSLEGTPEEFRINLDLLGLEYNLHVAKTQELLWDKPIDILLIDAGHDEKNVKPDCEKWIPFVKPGGIVLFDDWDENPNSAHYNVSKYGELHTKGWEDLGYVDGLEKKMKVKRRPKELNL